MSLGWEVGGWVASAVVRQLVDKVCSYISNQFNYEANTKHSLKSLHEYLIQIKAVLHEADQRRIENPDLKKWLLSLKVAIYDAGDVLDMVEYKILEDKIDKIEGKADQTSSISHALFKRARVVVESINFSGDELDKLNEVLDKLRRIVFDRDHLIELIKLQPTVSLRVSQMMQLRESTSMPIESNLFGRDEERALLMKFILKISDDDGGASSSRNVHVLPIAGIGGVGKTTLVQDVYNNQNVKDRFDLKAWVCVSDNFDVKRLTKEIIESASIDKPHDFYNLQNFNRILEILKCGLTGKRFLIVLDDVWNENNTKWEQLQSVLNCGKEGSRIVVTTRNGIIAKMVGTKEAIQLEGLDDEEFWSFFRQCSFGDENPANYSGLEFVGKQIAKKLKGNPLAAKTVGVLLKQKLNVEDWMEVLDSELWKTNEQEDGIMQALRLSYEYLPSYLKQCFVYCSLFPKDYRYEKTKLVRMWIAHGFILPSGQQILEKIGEAYFNELLSRSFIHEIFKNCYVIHDLLHDLAQSLSDGEIYIAENDEAHISSPKKVRHISICSNNLSLLCNDKLCNENVRSLVVFDCAVEKTLDVLSELKGLRVLVLHKFPVELSLKFIQKMLHLRYLEILRPYYQWDHSFNMPELVCKLYHLQVLQVKRGYSIDESCVLPNEINRLIKLRHLEAGTTKGIAWIGSLTLLQELKFKVNQGEKGLDIGQIRDMSELRTLCLEGLETVKTKEEASQAMLKNKEYLKDLKLLWKEDYHINLQNEEEEVIDVLESLQPHSIYLEELVIQGYRGSYPSWWNANWPSNLITLKLYDCSKWEFLPPLEHLPFLKVLHLQRMNAVRSIGSEFYASNSVGLSSKTIFPSLEQLTIYGMPELKDWYKIEEEGGFELFPRLKSFSIGGCPKLRGSIFQFPPSNFNRIMVLISQGRILYINGEGLIVIGCASASRLIEWLPYPNLLTSVEHLEIQAPEMRSIPTELEEWIQHLTSLHSLCFSCCLELESLPSKLINSLPTLRKLEIGFSPNIKSLPEEGLPASLQELHVLRCYDLAKRCMNEYWQKMIAHIPTFKVDDIEVTEDNRKSLKLITKW